MRILQIPGRATAVLIFASALPFVSLEAQATDAARIRSAVDSIAAAALAGGRAAGMSIAVVRGRDTLVLKGYGMADLELDVPTPARAVYEIGSVTKQFTAAAILLLAEEGKLSLDDEITKHLPDYPTQGHRITIRRLMDHSSGIQGYTEMQAFGALVPQRLPRDTLVKLFSSRPFKFAPGTAVAYNNSAYFLLGLIIEKVSGRSYGEFVKARLFDRVGMADSHYCDAGAVVKRRAHGYEMSPEGLRVKSYLDHTWPYAAGSLCSTVWDLVAWNQALHGGRVLSAASYREITTGDTLVDGTRIRYAKGLVNDSIAGRHAIHHGGGINGYLSHLAWFPDEQVTIAVLVNTVGPVSPDAITGSIAALLFGRPQPAAPVALDHPAVDYVGVFRGIGRGDSLTITVSADSGAVRLRIGGQGQGPVARYVGNDTFMIGRNRYAFQREGGRVTGLRADMISVVSRLTRRPG